MQVRLIEGAYVQLEDAYCLRSVEEAMRIAEPIEVCGLDVYHQFFFLSFSGFSEWFVLPRNPSVLMYGRGLLLGQKTSTAVAE